VEAQTSDATPPEKPRRAHEFSARASRIRSSRATHASSQEWRLERVGENFAADRHSRAEC
jgi:hypothetical protein